MDPICFSLTLSMIFPFILCQNYGHYWNTISINPNFDIEIYPKHELLYPSPTTTTQYGSFPFYPSYPHYWHFTTGPSYSENSDGAKTLTYANVQVTQHHESHFTFIHAYAIASVTISIPDST